MCFALNIEAQTFKAGGIIGLNASQIRGDDSAGFNKLGIVGGLKAAVDVGTKLEASIEILYSQRGSYQQATNNNPDEFRINTDYISIPLIISYKDWLADDDYYRLHFHTGLSYGRLINATINKEKNSPILEEFVENDFSGLFGATYYLNPNLALTARYTRSINKLFEGPGTSINSNSYLGFFLTFHVLYMI